MKSNANGLSSRARTWLWLSIAAVLIAIAGNVIGLSLKSIYSTLTPAFFPQAIAQDIASLVLVSPLWLILAILALRGSLRSYLVWLGVLVFTVYNYVIYTFSVPFGPLLPAWVAVLGLSLYALIGGITSVDHEAIAAAFTNGRRAKIAAWFLIVVAILFAFLWLSEDVPALLSGTRPQSLIDMAIPTNPVHILDLSFFLPGAVIVAIRLLKGKPLGFLLAPAGITFVILTGIPILITPFVQSARGEAAGWGVIVPIGSLVIVSTGLLIWLISTVRTKNPA